MALDLNSNDPAMFSRLETHLKKHAAREIKNHVIHHEYARLSELDVRILPPDARGRPPLLQTRHVLTPYKSKSYVPGRKRSNIETIRYLRDINSDYDPIAAMEAGIANDVAEAVTSTLRHATFLQNDIFGWTDFEQAPDWTLVAHPLIAQAWNAGVIKRQQNTNLTPVTKGQSFYCTYNNMETTRSISNDIRVTTRQGQVTFSIKFPEIIAASLPGKHLTEAITFPTCGIDYIDKAVEALIISKVDRHSPAGDDKQTVVVLTLEPVAAISPAEPPERWQNEAFLSVRRPPAVY